MKKEAHLQLQVCEFLRYQYPTVIWCCDLAAGMRLNIGQAVRAKKMRSSRGLPDIMIFFPNKIYHGLFIELKPEGTKLKNKDGIWATPHIKEQAEILIRLREIGYAGAFCCGFGEAKFVIDKYMKLR